LRFGGIGSRWQRQLTITRMRCPLKSEVPQNLGPKGVPQYGGSGSLIPYE